MRRYIQATILFATVFWANGVPVHAQVSRARAEFTQATNDRHAAASRIRVAAADCAAADAVLENVIQKYCPPSERGGSNELRSSVLAMKDLRDTFEDEKARALDELRRGLRCSKCHRTKSELEKDHIDFYEHIHEVYGTIVKATQAEIDAKAEEYDAKIRELTQVIADEDQAEKTRLKRSWDISSDFTHMGNALRWEIRTFGQIWEEDKAKPEYELFLLLRRRTAALAALQATPSSKMAVKTARQDAYDQLSQAVERQRAELRELEQNRHAAGDRWAADSRAELHELREIVGRLKDYVPTSGFLLKLMGVETGSPGLTHVLLNGRTSPYWAGDMILTTDGGGDKGGIGLGLGRQ